MCEVSEELVVFFGAGNYAETVFGELSKKYAPVAYGDNDRKKQGTLFMGLPVLSLDEIKSRYPDCRFFITTNECIMPSVSTSLVDGGIAPSRIINYEESKRYKSCIWLETTLRFNPLHLAFCCSDFGKNKTPSIELGANEYDKTMHDFFATRDRIIEELNLPIGADVKNPCLGCINIRDALWHTDRRIRSVAFSHTTFCNFSCSYCCTLHGVKDHSHSDIENSLGLFCFMKKNNIIDTNTEIYLVSGEITMHPRRDAIFAEVQDNPCCIFTNASAYSEKIDAILSMGRSKVYVSIDAGTRETFAKVKGVDAFDRVCENLARYSAGGDRFVHLKYIILPGLNDSEADIDGFIALCDRLRARVVDVSRDMLAVTPFDDRAINIAARMLHELPKRGVRANAIEAIFATRPGDAQRIEEKLAELKGATDLQPYAWGRVNPLPVTVVPPPARF
jgi:pyruvate-formate lyase-activating enzyme